ncbi:MAG: hypothetical protein NZ933_09255, partial [Bacteroidia bacterium]|nr:hypothetical protein [Bacteroidia bacterium]
MKKFIPFSQRYAASLLNKRLKIQLRKELRISLLRTMQKYSAYDSYHGIFITIERLIDRLMTQLGWKQLMIYENNEMQATDSFETFMEKTPHKHVIDAIEMYYHLLLGERQTHISFQEDVNHLF